jgi:hypothetical protein
LADSLYPTIASADSTLTKGNPLSMASVAASAVFPVPAGPSNRQVTRGVLALDRACRCIARRKGSSR